MKRYIQKNKRSVALLLSVLLIALVAAVPTLAMERRDGGRFGGRMGRDSNNVVGDIAEGAGDAVGDIVNGAGDAIGDVADGIESGMQDSDPMGQGTESGEGLFGDESEVDGTNVPDSDIGGAVDDNDNDGISDPKDTDDDNDGVVDKVDPDADGDGTDDGEESTGMIGIIITVLVVLAVIVLIIAVVPRARKK